MAVPWMLILEVTAALFAVFGFYCAMQLITEWFFIPENLAVAVEIRNKEDADMLEMLLHEARSASFRKGHTRLVVLLSTDLLDGTVGSADGTLGERYLSLLEEYGAECLLIDPA